MGDIVDEKAPLQELPVYESGKADTGAGAGADADIYKRKRIHRPGKVLVLFGMTALLMWLFNCGWRGRTAPKAIDHWDLRKRWIDTGAQALDAELDLFDLLSIQSWSGSVNVGIHPQPADEANPVPAELLINSYSGSVSVNFLALNAPERDYHVSIDSYSGSIDGTILHGRRTSIASKSARIDIQFTLYGAGDYSSTLSTTSSSGSQDITLLSPTKQPGTSIKEMSSVHSTTSGSLVLRYPREWEGTIEGHTQSGSIQLHGRDLDIAQRSSFQTVGHHVIARKGNGNSTLNFLAGSGSVDIYFN